MTLDSGARVGVYRILSALGAGGMGEVYRAHDTTLGRDVAIKILPEHFADDRDRLARFEREARTLAALNHPNIAAIYGLERAASSSVLVMELAEGETLAARIARGRLPVDEAIGIALQIAAALEAAHEKGVVHRDLKPANIVIARGERVKVLDFGLAKLAGAGDADSALFNAANSPTMAASMVGTILGTAAYMSPEQARGKVVDKRADIWAFGCVVFEMLAGVPAFKGETIPDIVAAVVTHEPDWSMLPPDVPPTVRSVLRRCLRKDPGERLHDAADARIELQERPEHTASAVTPRTARSRSVERAGIALVAGSLAAGIAWTAARTTPVGGVPSATVTRLELNSPADVDLYSGNAPGVALSPDGRRIAFIGIRTGSRSLYIRPLDAFDAAPLRGTEQAQTFFFSPDGSSIGFITPDRVVKRVSLSDGLVVPLARNADQYSGAEWGADGLIRFNRDGPLHQVPATGGAVTPLTTLDASKHELLHAWPNSLPDGKAILFATLAGDFVKVSRIDAFVAATGKRRELVTGTFPQYVASGHLVFLREKDLLAAPFDPQRIELTGPAVRVVENVGLDSNGAPLASVSAAGSLAYVPAGNGASRLVWVARDGSEQPVTASTGRYQSPRLAPDGRRIAVNMEGNLWVYDTTRGTLTRLSPDETIGSGFMAWDPTGKRVAFRGRTGMRWIDADAASQSRPIDGSSGVSDVPNSIGPDGDTVAFTRASDETSGDVWVASLSGRFAPRPMVNTPAYEGGAQFSPDGRWLAYASNESGRFQVYVKSYDDTQRRFAVSSDGGNYALWRRDGKELFYRNGNKMMAVSVGANASELMLSPPRMLFERRYSFETSTISNYDISVDGTRFLMVKDEVGAGRINVVLNWFEELKRLAPK